MDKQLKLVVLKDNGMGIDYFREPIAIVDSREKAVDVCRGFIAHYYKNILQVYDLKHGIAIDFRRFNKEYTARFIVIDFNLNEWQEINNG